MDHNRVALIGAMKGNPARWVKGAGKAKVPFTGYSLGVKESDEVESITRNEIADILRLVPTYGPNEDFGSRWSGTKREFKVPVPKGPST
jgi:hypothetical protein